ncbi:Disease resistance protein [Corchorus olitorius]|uniref:Disease resistance protein n=1 Tax=Corchorus olitorius TaxID=93759 RepID=A0A1R3H0D1_9ROSI|nr:Disease resistance protein [Corchorus olitorius]
MSSPLAALLWQLYSFTPEFKDQMESVITKIREFENEKEKLTSNFEDIQAVLEDAERRQVKEASVRRWLFELKNIAYDAENMIDKFQTQQLQLEIEKREREGTPFLKKVRLCCSEILFRYNTVSQIKELNEQLDVIVSKKNKLNLKVGRGFEGSEWKMTTSFIDGRGVCGREGEKRSILEMLGEITPAESNPEIISILGMRGIGKTTLAQIAYNNSSGFDNKIWVSVSFPFDETRIVRAILESLQSPPPYPVELESLLKRVNSIVKRKKFLLVLDDLWLDDDRKWEPLIRSLSCDIPGSKILMTTHNEKVATVVGCTKLFRLGELSEEDCWSLFKQAVCSGKIEKEYNDLEDLRSLEDIGKKIAKKCKGLPLAAKILGGLLRFQRNIEQWQGVLDSEIWELDEAERIKVNGDEEDNSLLKYVRHLNLKVQESSLSSDFLDDIKKVRSLQVELEHRGSSMKSACLSRLFQNLTCLRTLNLSSSLIKELPTAIKCLIHLRYLDLSKNRDLIELPDEVCDLCNLQTLDLTNCMRLSQLPHGIGKLINLRHLENRGTLLLKFFPKGIASLTSLRTLRKFTVNSSIRDCEVSTVEDLGNLQHLGGELEIQGLANVRDKSEAEKAQLREKNHLRQLHLSFQGSRALNGRSLENAFRERKLILEVLQPPPQLEILKIEGYTGHSILPDWMMFLTKVRRVEFCKCTEWMSLPTLGKLPSLESLIIKGMRRVKRLGFQFLERHEGQPSSSSLSVAMYFPKLVYLQFEDMKEWETWDLLDPATGREQNVTVMPCLRSLLIYDCPKVEAIPDCLHQNRTLQKLDILRSPKLEERCKKDTGESWHNISYITNIRINNEDVQGNNN